MHFSFITTYLHSGIIYVPLNSPWEACNSMGLSECITAIQFSDVSLIPNPKFLLPIVACP